MVIAQIKLLKNLFFVIVVMLVIVLAPPLNVIGEEVITLTTIAPTQDAVRVDKGTVGVNYRQTSVLPDENIDDNNLLIEGNVGIGMTNPVARLDVMKKKGPGIQVLSGAVDQWTSIDIGREIGEAQLGIAGEANNFAVGVLPGDVVMRVSDSSKKLHLSVTNATSPEITVTEGNVGIANTSPTARLDVMKKKGPGIQVLSLGASDWTSIDIGREIGEAQWGIVGEANNFTVGAQPGDAVIRVSDSSKKLHLSVADATSPEITITESNVGIANTSPTARLDVMKKKGPGIQVLSLGYSDWTSIDIGRMAGEAQWGIVGEANNFTVGAQPGDVVMRVSDSSKKLHFSITNATSPEITIIQGGVGIGTTNPGTYKCNINGTGYLNAAAWVYGSDKRLKKNISYIQSGLDVIEQLKPVKFDYINGDKKQAGFVAQEISEVLPDIVTEGRDGMLGTKTTSIIPYLVKAIQQQQKEIESLQAKLERLI